MTKLLMLSLVVIIKPARQRMRRGLNDEKNKKKRKKEKKTKQIVCGVRFLLAN